MKNETISSIGTVVYKNNFYSWKHRLMSVLRLK